MNERIWIWIWRINDKRNENKRKKNEKFEKRDKNPEVLVTY